MSDQGIIAILLTVVGFLIVSWFAVVWFYLKERFRKVDESFKMHGARIQVLEMNRIEEQVHREEILDILRGIKNVG